MEIDFNEWKPIVINFDTKFFNILCKVLKNEKARFPNNDIIFDAKDHGRFRCVLQWIDEGDSCGVDCYKYIERNNK